DPTVQLVLGAVVGVQGDLHVVVLGDVVGVLGQRDRARDLVLDGGSGQVLGAAGRDLNDAVAAGVGETAKRRVQRLRRGDVDRWVGKGTCLRAIEHLRVGLRGCNGHGSSLT